MRQCDTGKRKREGRGAGSLALFLQICEDLELTVAVVSKTLQDSMFAKVFGQIFDSSIAEDYNCRRMFMDLLVLADSDGVVDMTKEAIARRTNVPLEEVEKYIAELQQPDNASRSKLHEGKRLIPVDVERDWGWKIVNFRHYRQIRDEEARRSYFRDQKRKQRARKPVRDKKVDNGGRCQTVASASSSLSESVQTKFTEWISVRKAIGKPPKSWDKMFNEQIKWLQQFDQAGQIEVLSASIRNNWQGLFAPKTYGTNQKHSTESSRSVGTLNEGKSAQYAGVGKV